MVKHLIFAGLAFLLSLSGCSLLIDQDAKPAPVETMIVGPELVNCVNPTRENLCLQIKQRQNSPWELYTGRITGLEYVPGFIYELKVQAERPTLIEGETNWILYKIESTTPVQRTTDVAIDIRDGVWFLREFKFSGRNVKAIGESEPQINFSMDNHISGNTGCNTYTGIYSISGGRMKFDAVSSSKSMCPGNDGMLEQEQTILNTLSKIAIFELKDGSLVITPENNSTQLIFTH